MTEPENRTVTIVPAQPGWFVATLIEGFNEFALDPIIAWEMIRREVPYARYLQRADLCVLLEVSPITTEGRMDGDSVGNLWCIKRPDGKFESPADCTWDNEAEAIKELTSRLKPRKAAS